MHRICSGRTTLVILAQLLLTAIAFGQSSSNSTIVSIRSAEEVIRKWTADRHVYIKGDVGVGGLQLTALQDWIEANAQHWTVVLLENAEGEQHREADGRIYFGMDAVEYALGRGLSNQTDFGKLEHPLTKERDGAVFVLYLSERKFSYFASDAQDRRGLGEANWVGQLDQPAFRAMRGGGRIVDAVQDTITSINERLNNAIQSEQNAELAAELERQRAVETVRRTAEEVGERIENVKIAAANFRRSYPLATGPLAAPPMSQWATKLTMIATDVDENSARSFAQQLNTLSTEMDRFLNGYAAAQGLEAQQLETAIQLSQLDKAPGGVAGGSIATAQAKLAEAASTASAGNFGIDALVAEVEQVIALGKEAVKAEEQRIAGEQLRRKWIRVTIAAMLAIAATVFAAILGILNYRRRPAKQEAQKKLAEQEAVTRSETDNINVLFARNSEILGDRDRLRKRGYEGATKEISERALDYVDDLFIMSKEARRVIEEAKSLVYPRGWIGKLVNLFSSSRYQQAVNQVTGKPLRFTKLDGLPLALRDSIPLNEDGTTPDEVMMTFDAVYAAFKKRGDEAEIALDTIENCLAEVHETLSASQTALLNLASQEKALALAAEQDHYFQLPSFFEELIPSVQADLVDADKQAAFDAVRAMQECIPAANRKMSEANELAGYLSNARAKLFPWLTSTAQTLQSRAYLTDWIDRDLHALGEQANSLMAKTTRVSIAGELPSIADALAGLRSKCEHSVALATKIEDVLQPELTALSSRIETTRSNLARRLNLSEANVLNEADRDPDDWQAAAVKNLETARDTLSLGRNDVAQSAIEAAEQAAAQADALLADSTEAAREFSSRQHTVQEQHDRLLRRIPQVTDELIKLQHRFERSSFVLQDFLWTRKDPAEQASDSPPQASELIGESRAPVAEIERSLLAAAEDQTRGHVLTAADRQGDAGIRLARSHQMLDAVEQHLQLIATSSRENESTFDRLDSRFIDLSSTCRDPLITAATIDAVRQLQRGIQSQRRGIAVAEIAPNPFEIAAALSKSEHDIAELDALLVADRQAHAEASRAVAGARRQLEAALQLVQQSQNDGIPDSRLTTHAAGVIATLESKLIAVERDLNGAHGDWKAVDYAATQLQVDLRASADTLSSELSQASQALASFQTASREVFQAEHWSGAFGINVLGSPGVRELERARSGLQQGDYSSVFELSRVAIMAAQVAIQQAEREVSRRRLAAQQAEEAERRRRAARQATSLNIGTRNFGRSIGGGPSSRSSSGSRPSGNTSGFSRSGW